MAKEHVGVKEQERSVDEENCVSDIQPQIELCVTVGETSFQ
jgi:hypothetical protein